MGSFIYTFEGSDDIQDNNSAADRTLIDMIEEISLEKRLCTPDDLSSETGNTFTPFNSLSKE